MRNDRKDFGKKTVMEGMMKAIQLMKLIMEEMMQWIHSMLNYDGRNEKSDAQNEISKWKKQQNRSTKQN